MEETVNSEQNKCKTRLLAEIKYSRYLEDVADARYFSDSNRSGDKARSLISQDTEE